MFQNYVIEDYFVVILVLQSPQNNKAMIKKSIFQCSKILVIDKKVLMFIG